MTSPTEITATVPDNAATGAVTLHTLASATPVTGPTFTVAPSILGFTPVDAAPGATIALNGSGLANVLTVTFGGGAATAPATTVAEHPHRGRPSGCGNRTDHRERWHECVNERRRLRRRLDTARFSGTMLQLSAEILQHVFSS